MSDLIQDFVGSLRFLVRKPLFSAVVVLTLGLGIGATTAVFSVINGVLLRPLPYDEPDRLTMLWSHFDVQGRSREAFSGPELIDLRERANLFDGLGAIWARYGSLSDGREDPEQIHVGWVTADFFDVLGAEPLLGSTFRAEDLAEGQDGVILLSHGVWQQRFGGDRSIVGQSVIFNETPCRVVGVMPKGFRVMLPDDALVPRDLEAWLPMGNEAAIAGMSRSWRVLTVVGRLRSDTSLGTARAQVSSIASLLAEEHAEYAESGLGIDAVALHDDLVAHLRPALQALALAVVLVVLVACANVAHLLLLRAAERSREMAMRAALGASRMTLVRQVLSESLMLVLWGGALGVLLADLGVRLLVKLEPAHLPRVDAIGVDLQALGVAALAVLLTSLLFGAAPAFFAARPQLVSSLKQGGRSATTGGRNQLRRVLVVAEIALTLVLLVGAGLLLRSFFELRDVDAGFEAEGLQTLKISLPSSRYSYREPEKITSFYQQVGERIDAMPEVATAGFLDFLPLSGMSNWEQSYSAMTAGGVIEWGSRSADYRVITPDALEALGTQLVSGRFFDHRDDLDHPNVVLVDEKLAKRTWPGESAVGKMMTVGVFLRSETRQVEAEVVGVVEHVRYHGLRTEGQEQIYLPHLQSPQRHMSLAARLSSPTVDPSALVQAIRGVVLEVDSGSPAFDIRPMVSWVDDAMAETRFVLLLIGLFAGLGLTLATIGIYGVVAFMVSQSTFEMSLRLALGARVHQILAMVVGQGLQMAAAGVTVGLILALAISRLLSSLLFGVEAFDPTTFAGVALTVLLVAVLASYLPARRASRVDPARALRGE